MFSKLLRGIPDTKYPTVIRLWSKLKYKYKTNNSINY